jgi:hypothetical protein
MAEEHQAQHPYKCAVCGDKFDLQEQLQDQLKEMHEKPLTTKVALYKG